MTETSRCSCVSLLLVVLIAATIGSSETPAFAQAASTMSGVVQTHRLSVAWRDGHSEKRRERRRTRCGD